MRPTRALLALGLLACQTFPAAADEDPATTPPVIETPQLKIFNGKWVQDKSPEKHGLLMYLTQTRAAAGDYFSVKCGGTSRMIELGFGEKLPGVAGKDGQGKEYKALDKLTVDGGFGGTYRLQFTGTTDDPQFAKGKVYGYRILFDSAEETTQFIDAMRKGKLLDIQNQAEPIDLTGSADALDQQAAYCTAR